MLGGISEPTTNGIYVPNDGANVVGGVYVRGNQGQSSDNAIVNMAVNAGNNPVYTISQGAGAASVVTVDLVNNQTTVQDPSGSNTYTGQPDGINNEGILIYVNDYIGGLSGTVQRDTQITVSSERDIVISNHILYQDYTTSPLSADGFENTLGILSWGGDVRIGTGAPNDLNIHGVIMAPHGVFTVDNYRYGSPRGSANLLGGVITDFYGAFGTFRSGVGQVSGYGRNFVYDARMLSGTAPPYFPYMSNFTSAEDGLADRLIWNGGD